MVESTANVSDKSWTKSARDRRPSPVARELTITWLVIKDNWPVGVLPLALFSWASGLHNGLDIYDLLEGFIKSLILGPILVYSYDSWNQAWSPEEDRLNKPHRPLPSGLVTPRGMIVRAIVSAVVLALFVTLLDAWPFILLWPVNIILQVLFFPPRYYFIWKQLNSLVCHFLLIYTGWNLGAPIDSTAWAWIVTMSIYFTLTFNVEDWRDIEGDRVVGRRTPIMIFGQTPVRVWFAILMTVLPTIIYFILGPNSGSHEMVSGITAVAIGAVSWVAAWRALFKRTQNDDRTTYHLFIAIWGLTFSSAPILLG